MKKIFNESSSMKMHPTFVRFVEGSVQKALITLFLALTALAEMMAQTSVLQTKTGSAITGTMVVESDYYGVTPLPFITNSEKIRVKLSLNDAAFTNFYPDCWQVTVKYNITVFTNPTTSSTINNESLTINFENNATASSRLYTDIAFKEYTGQRVSIQITGLEFRQKTGCTTLGAIQTTFPTATPWNLVNWNEVVFSGEYIADRTFQIASDPYTQNVYHLPATTSIPAIPANYNYCDVTQSGFYDTPNNELTLRWSSHKAAVRYDIEWIFIEVPGTASFDQRFEFNWDDATRISTTETSFILPLAYPRGKLIYRYRIVSKVDNGGGVYRLKEEPWSDLGGLRGEENLDQTNANGTPTSTYARNYINYCGMEPGKNWVYSAGYSENALRTEELTFLDAMDRDRQILGYSQTERNVVGMEMYYDREGRHAATSMPIPGSTQGTKFYNGFGGGFNYTNTYENNPTTFTGLPVGHKAFEFYSASSPYATAFPQLPSAGGGYAMSHVRYNNNGSGIISEESLPGPDHKMGGRHTLKTLEVDVLQNELDRLFGNEVGYAEHYKKRISTDPNGQKYVEYFDGDDRLIASALKNLPNISNVSALPNTGDPTTVELITNSPLQADGSAVTQKELYFQEGVVNTFTYNLAAASETLPCLNITYPCLYDLEIYVLNDQDVRQDLSVPGIGTVTAITQTAVAATSNFVFTFTAPADGNYRIIKRTRLNETSIDAYAAEVSQAIIAQGISPQNTCIPIDIPGNTCTTCAQNCENAYTYTLTMPNGTVVTIYEQSVNDVSYSYTNDPAVQAAFPDDVVLNAAKVTEIQQQIARCVEDCESDEVIMNTDPCYAQRKLLLKDMSPGGQYFDNSPTTFAMVNPPASLMDAWLNNYVPPFVKISIAALNPTYLTGSSSWSAIRANWLPAMANILLPFHPEYCQYDYFCQYTNGTTTPQCGKEGSQVPNHWGTSAGFELAMNNTLSDADAIAQHLFDPLNGNANLNEAYYALGHPTEPPVNVPAEFAGYCDYADPYFTNPNNAALKTMMEGYLNNYIENPFSPGNYFSIWDILDPASILSGNTFNMSDPGHVSLHTFLTTLNDQFTNGPITRYAFFKGYYFFRKQGIIQGAYSLWVAEGNCGSCTDPVLMACNSCSDPSAGCPECFLSSLDQNSDGQIDAGTIFDSPDLACSEPAFDYSGFFIRYPYNPVYNAGSPSTGIPLYCDNSCEGYAIQWISQLKQEYLGCLNWMDEASELALKNQLIAYCIGECQGTPPSAGGGTPDYSGANAVAQSFITSYNAAHNPDIVACPDLYTDVVSTEENKLSCQCGNLAEMLIASGALNTTAIPDFNPVKLSYYLTLPGNTLSSLVNTATAETFINNVLAEMDYTGTAVTWTMVQDWLNDCAANQLTTLPSVPVEISCENGGVDVLTCTELNDQVNDPAIQAAFNQQLQQFLAQFRENMKQKCLSGLVDRESLTMTYILDEYQYTLYYYDRAGNLIKTVPPQGVVFLTDADIQLSMAYREANHSSIVYAYTNMGTQMNASFVRPKHFLVTNYKYSSLNQLIETFTPDENKKTCLYDVHGRLLLTQDAKQASQNKYLYIHYDNMGRMDEQGEITQGSSITVKQAADPAFVSGTIFGATAMATRSQVCLALYNEHQTTTGLNSVVSSNVLFQRNLVTSLLYFEATPNAGNSNYLNATHYQYNEDGMVQKVIQDFPFLNQFYARFATTEYIYNMIDGLVSEVKYNTGKKDQYFHRYTYDKDGRPVRVETSRDYLIWDQDATYFYNPLGQIVRKELGDRKVQGVDYVYTLMGMLKGVNGGILHPGIADPGKDGLSFAVTNPNNRFARDAMGFNLHYYQGDYQSVNPFSSATQFSSTDVYTGTSGGFMPQELGVPNGKRGLWNGNVTAMSTAILKSDETYAEALTQVYGYDVMMRLLIARSFSKSGVFDNYIYGGTLNNNWASVSETMGWRTEYSYDKNGNVRSLLRRDPAGLLIDGMAYYYDEPSSRMKTNRLYHVTDFGVNTTSATDYKCSTAVNTTDVVGGNNFRYNAIGQLVKDISPGEQIDNIEWDARGNLKKVDRTINSTKPDIEFYYNANGQRIMKIVKPNGGAGAVPTWQYTIWSYDLGGNIMAEYTIDAPVIEDFQYYGLVLKNYYIYGDSKIGKDTREIKYYSNLLFNSYTQAQSCVSCATASVLASPSYAYGNTVHKRILGHKQFELTNHTGNVVSVVTDRKIQVDIGTFVSGTNNYNATTDRRLDYYMPDVVEATDYYPGGMPMTGRYWADNKFSEYLWGHNGQYKDNELYGNGNAYAAAFWEYDSRLLRRWNPDPMSDLSNSVYEVFNSNPIVYADPLGLKPKFGEQMANEFGMELENYFRTDRPTADHSADEEAIGSGRPPKVLKIGRLNIQIYKRRYFRQTGKSRLGIRIWMDPRLKKGGDKGSGGGKRHGAGSAGGADSHNNKGKTTWKLIWQTEEKSIERRVRFTTDNRYRPSPVRSLSRMTRQFTEPGFSVGNMRNSRGTTLTSFVGSLTGRYEYSRLRLYVVPNDHIGGLNRSTFRKDGDRNNSWTGTIGVVRVPRHMFNLSSTFTAQTWQRRGMLFFDVCHGYRAGITITYPSTKTVKRLKLVKVTKKDADDD